MPSLSPRSPLALPSLSPHSPLALPSNDTDRTSENAFDTNSELARILKKRAFELLGVLPYEEMMADGLQVLRYNQTTAYRDHLGSPSCRIW